MKTIINTNKLLEWLLNVAGEFEMKKNEFKYSDRTSKLFDEFCLKKVSERIEFIFWEEKAIKHLKLFLSSQPSYFDQLTFTFEK